MIEPSDQVMIVCADKGLPGAKGKLDICCKCSDEIFLSDTSLNSVLKNGLRANILKLYCISCAIPEMKNVKHFYPLTEEQISEIERST